MLNEIQILVENAYFVQERKIMIKNAIFPENKSKYSQAGLKPINPGFDHILV